MRAFQTLHYTVSRPFIYLSPLFLKEKSNQPCWGPFCFEMPTGGERSRDSWLTHLLPPALLLAMGAWKQFITVTIADANTRVTDGHVTWSMSSGLSLR